MEYREWLEKENAKTGLVDFKWLGNLTDGRGLSVQNPQLWVLETGHEIRVESTKVDDRPSRWTTVGRCLNDPAHAGPFVLDWEWRKYGGVVAASHALVQKHWSGLPAL